MIICTGQFAHAGKLAQDGVGAMGRYFNMFNKPLRPLPDPIITIK
jgi:hypothetical protein